MSREHSNCFHFASVFHYSRIFDLKDIKESTRILGLILKLKQLSITESENQTNFALDMLFSEIRLLCLIWNSSWKFQTNNRSALEYHFIIFLIAWSVTGFEIGLGEHTSFILILYSMFKDSPANGQFVFWRKTGKLMFITISNPSDRVCRVCYFPNINFSRFWIWLCVFIEFHSLPNTFTQQYQMFSV